MNCGNYVLDRGGDRRGSRPGDHESSTFPELAAEGAARVPARGPLADRQHAEGAARRAGARRVAPGVARDVRGSPAMLTRRTSRRSTAGRFDVTARREAVGLRADLGADRHLLRQGALREGGPLALAAVPREKDESWLVQSGRASSSSATRARRRSLEEVVGPGSAFHYRPGHRPPRHRARGHDDPRGLDAAARRRRAPRGRLRPRRHLRALRGRRTFTRL